jgi:hypothetical protein
MEALSQGLMAISSAIGAVAAACAVVGVVGIIAGAFLVYTDKTTFEDVARFIKMFRKGGGNWPR